MEIWEQEKAMESNVQCVFSHSNHRRVATIILLATCMLCCIPQNVFCLTQETIARELLETTDEAQLKDQFDALEQSIKQSDDSMAAGRKFLESFLAQIKSQYGVSLTIPEACRLIKENLHMLEIPPETKEPLLNLIKTLSPRSNLQLVAAQVIQTSSQTDPNADLPGNVYVGAIEVFAGALLCIIPSRITWRLGGAMIVDGSRRIVDGFIQAKDEERLNHQ
jgi:hypothetical protein